MATKWLGSIRCVWCDGQARAGIEKGGTGRTYRVICDSCGAATQVGKGFPTGRRISEELAHPRDDTLSGLFAPSDDGL